MRVLICNRWWTAFAFAAVVGLVFAILAASPARAEGPPLGDCFGGTLASDPLNCYLLEQTQRDGLIEIAAIYYADDRLIYVYLSQTKPVDDDKVGRGFRKKAEQFIDRWPDIAFREPLPFDLQGCVGDHYWGLQKHVDYKYCLLEGTRWEGDDILPLSGSYGRILVRAGGADARRSEPGWATLVQLWPATLSGASGSPDVFDVSDVDLTNFPDFPICDVPEADRRSCPPERDNTAGQASGGGVVYIQYKNPPKGKKELEALKEKLFPYCKRVAVCTEMFLDTSTNETTMIATATSTKPGSVVTFHGPLTNATSTLRIVSEDLGHYHGEVKRLLSVAYPNESRIIFTSSNPEHDYVTGVEIIPVKHNYADLRRYETILNRFVASRGNTVGILGAELSTNLTMHYEKAVLWTPNGPGEVETPRYDDDPPADTARIRTTIVLEAFDSQRVVNALPQLLPTLGVSLDAVGAVHERGYREYDEPQGGGTIPDILLPLCAECLGQPHLHSFLHEAGVPTWIPMWVNYSVLGVLVLGVIGGVVFSMYRAVVGLARLARRRA